MPFSTCGIKNTKACKGSLEVLVKREDVLKWKYWQFIRVFYKMRTSDGYVIVTVLSASDQLSWAVWLLTISFSLLRLCTGKTLGQPWSWWATRSCLHHLEQEEEQWCLGEESKEDKEECWTQLPCCNSRFAGDKNDSDKRGKQTSLNGTSASWIAHKTVGGK